MVFCTDSKCLNTIQSPEIERHSLILMMSQSAAFQAHDIPVSVVATG